MDSNTMLDLTPYLGRKARKLAVNGKTHELGAYVGAALFSLPFILLFIFSFFIFSDITNLVVVFVGLIVLSGSLGWVIGTHPPKAYGGTWAAVAVVWAGFRSGSRKINGRRVQWYVCACRINEQPWAMMRLTRVAVKVPNGTTTETGFPINKHKFK